MIGNTSLNIEAQNLYKEAQALFCPFDKEMSRFEYIKTIFIELALYIPRYYQKHKFIKLCLQEISKQPKIEMTEDSKIYSKICVRQEKVEIYIDKREQLLTLKEIFKLAKQSKISDDLIKQETCKIEELVLSEMDSLENTVKLLEKQPKQLVEATVEENIASEEKTNVLLKNYSILEPIKNLVGINDVAEGLKNFSNTNYRKGVFDIGMGLGKAALLTTFVYLGVQETGLFSQEVMKSNALVPYNKIVNESLSSVSNLNIHTTYSGVVNWFEEAAEIFNIIEVNVWNTTVRTSDIFNATKSLFDYLEIANNNINISVSY